MAHVVEPVARVLGAGGPRVLAVAGALGVFPHPLIDALVGVGHGALCGGDRTEYLAAELVVEPFAFVFAAFGRLADALRALESLETTLPVFLSSRHIPAYTVPFANFIVPYHSAPSCYLSLQSLSRSRGHTCRLLLTQLPSYRSPLAQT